MISGERIKQAREILGMTQANLAELIGLHQSNIARLEQGIYQPLNPIIQGIAMATGFPLSFFKDDPTVDIPLGSLLYRKRAALKSSYKSTLRQISRLLIEIGFNLSRTYGTISLKLPSSSGDPVRDARSTRQILGFSEDQPIPNLTRAIEKTGVFVIALWIEFRDHDAFSVWTKTDNPKPVLVVGPGKPGDRLRFSLAHELGHLILHRAVQSGQKLHEREADAFASELLLPTAAMLSELTPRLNLTRLAELKGRWGVSMQALLIRALHLQLITMRQYKYLMQQLAARGWRTKEPVEIPVERPRLLRQLLEKAYGAPVASKRVAEEFKIPERLVQHILDSQAGEQAVTYGRDNRRVLKLSITLN